MAVPSPRRDFTPDDILATAPSAIDQAPALSSSRALARFEFEFGRGNEGTKILMVEWEDEEGEQAHTGDWEVSWEGKSTVLSAKDGVEERLHRLYFLLAPGVSIPPIVKLAQKGGKTMQTNPLPALFPPELGVTATTAGKKGVLHTVYAKKRLSVLQKEIEREMTNGEGVGLEMAIQEKQWIEENFGVGPRVVPDFQSPTSPKSPGGSRLTEKLKGLKLGTTASDLASTQPPSNNPLSPETGDVAVSSFALFHSAQPPRHTPRTIVQHPPDYLRSNSQINSLDAITSGQIPPKDDEVEEGLFAVRMSPRSPEMTKSPFSFTTKDTAPWLRDQA